MERPTVLRRVTVTGEVVPLENQRESDSVLFLSDRESDSVLVSSDRQNDSVLVSCDSEDPYSQCAQRWEDSPVPGPSALQQGGEGGFRLVPYDSTDEDEDEDVQQEDVQYGPEEPFHVVDQRVNRAPNFRHARVQTVLRLRDPPAHTERDEWLVSVIDRILDYHRARNQILPADRVALTILNSANPTRPIHLSFRRSDQLVGAVVLTKIERVVQSNEDFILQGVLEFSFQHISVPHGGSRHRQKGENIRDWAQRKTRSVVSIQNDDQMCLARAIVVGKAHVDGDERFEILRHSNLGEQEEEAAALCERAGVDRYQPCSLEEVQTFQNVLPAYSVNVFGDVRGKSILFRGPACTPEHPRASINIIFMDSHFDTIISLKGAFEWVYFCQTCLVGFSVRGGHHCPGACFQCRGPVQCQRERNGVDCDRCGRRFNNANCFNSHRTQPVYDKGRTVCDVIRHCKQCGKTYNLRQREEGSHRCGEKYCVTCKSYVDQNHLCYMQRAKKSKLPDKHMFVFFDIETTQETAMVERDGTKEHKPNLLISHQVCDVCLSLDEDEVVCEACGPRQQVFTGENTIRDFFTFLRNFARLQFKEVIAIAHNGKGYDFHFLLRHITVELGWTPEVLCSGQKILSIKVEHIQFKDSLNYLAIPLKKFASTFGLEDAVKGYFPYFFNTEENWNYEGALPAMQFYGPETMSEKEYKDFQSWYDELHTSGYVFKMQEEIKSYCKQDVSILRRGCLAFRTACLTATHVDPFRECVTLPSTCMLVFRRNFYNPQSVGLIPPGGYRCADPHSMESIEWLSWTEHRLRGEGLDVQIQHAQNGREWKVLGYKVDGFAVVNGIPTCWEYNGCYFHGCPKCFPAQHFVLHSHPHENMAVRFVSTTAKKERLENSGYDVITMWACQWAEEKRVNPAVREFLQHHPARVSLPLNPRDAFYGGRTNAIKTFHRCVEGEKIEYLDFTSLYPDVNKNAIYPVGHPDIITGPNFPDMNNITGLVKCKVLEPRGMFFPVLPLKINKKLVFPLCKKCAEEQHQQACTHTDEERAFHGTWVSYEVQAALERGYKVISIDEAWHYPKVTQYNKDTGLGGLFAPYINLFLKGKTEASGWPAWVKTDADKDTFISSFKQCEGVTLEHEKISPNPGMRNLFKYLLNAFWGKLGQRDDLTRTVFVRSYAEELELITNPSVKVLSAVPLNDELMMINYKPRDVALTGSSNTNVVLAAFTTAHARLKLLKAMEQLGDRVLYHDTDSVIFTTAEGQPTLPRGDFLGQFTDEVASCYPPGSYIDMFAAAGPKNYGYRVRVGGSETNTKTALKIRGITMNHGNSDQVHFDALVAMVLGDKGKEVIHIPRAIVRVAPWRIGTTAQQKTWQPCLTKRRKIGHNTVPYGYEDEDEH